MANCTFAAAERASCDSYMTASIDDFSPYAVVFNAAPPKREGIEAPAVTLARRYLAQLEVPVWGGQISHRASLSLSLAGGDTIKEYDADPSAAAELASLWSAIEKSLKVIHGARDKAAMHRVAA